MTLFLVAIALITFSIFIHELGHFLVARSRKLVVPRFSIFGIGKPIVSRKWRGVEFCICWLPIGAYVMVPQLADLGDFEGDVPAGTPPLPPADYLSKVLVAIAGPLANILFAFVLACIVWIVGVKVLPEYNRTEVGEVARQVETSAGKIVPGPAAAAGLLPGDVIRQVDGRAVANYQELTMAIILGNQVAPDGRRVATITLERDGGALTKQVYPELVGREGLRTIGIIPRSDLLVEAVMPDGAAAKAGLMAGDRIVSVDGKLLTRRDELRQHFQKKNAEASTLVVKRGEKQITTSLQPTLSNVNGDPSYVIGIMWHFDTVYSTPFEQFGDTCRQIYRTLASIFNRRSDIGVRHMSGIVGMVDNLEQAASAGFIPMISFLLAINLSLAIFNLLPIPVLDGGHILIATVTKLRGRPPNPLWLQKAVAACFVMLLGFIAYVGYHDIRRVIEDRFDDSRVAAPAKPAPAPAPPAK